MYTTSLRLFARRLMILSLRILLNMLRIRCKQLVKQQQQQLSLFPTMWGRQTVGESVKKIYSNVVHDFLPPLGDSKQAKAEAVSKIQHDARGSHIRSMVGIKEKHRHSNERESSKEQDTVDLQSCDTTERDYPVQFIPLHYSDSPQVAETGLHWKEDSDAAIYNNREMVLEENVVGENYPAARYLSSPREENSSELASYWREQHLLTVNLESPEDGNLDGPSEISNNGDQRNIILADFCQRDLVEDAGLRTFQKDKTTCNSADLSEEAEAGLSLKQDGETAFDNISEIDVEENATVKEHPPSEHTSSFEGKDSFKLLCTKEPRPVADDLCPLKDESLSIRSSTDEDHKTAVLMKYSQEIWVPDTVLRVVPGEQAADNYADPCEEAVTNLSLEHDPCVGFLKHGVGHEANVRKDHLVVDSRSSPNYISSSDLSLRSRERHLAFEDSSALEDKILDKSLLISTNEEHKLTTLDKFLPQTSVNDEEPRVLQEEEGVFNRTSCSNETETDFSLDGYCSCVSLDFSVEENDLVEKHAVTEHLDCPEIISSCDLSLYPRKLHLETEGFSSPKAENSSESSLISSSEDTIPAEFSPDTSVHDAGIRSFQKDETACNSLSDVLSTSLSSEPASSCISWKHNMAETEASISAVSTKPLDMLEISLANSTQKTEKVCRDYTDSGVCVSALSSISSASFSDASGKKAVNLIPAFPRTASSADTSESNEIDSLVESSGNKPQQFFEDDSGVGIADVYVETIEPSDKPKLEESCVILDSELYAASCRPRKFRSYKQLIQDAFTSRKRLIKEYEQLPIWFGDIDADINLHSEQCVLPCATSASKTSQENDLGESEWELL